MPLLGAVGGKSFSGGQCVAIIQSADLEARGLLNDQSSTLKIQGRWFKPGPAFTKSLLQTALEFCEDARRQGKQYLLIEFPTYFMAWRRFQPKTSVQAQAAAESQSTQSDAQTPPPRASNPKSAALSKLRPPVAVDSDFIRRCKSELALYVGPMASFLTEQALAQSDQTSPSQLVELLALHIPDSKAALAFRQVLLSS